MKTQKTPTNGSAYAVSTGTYAGEMLIFIEEDDKRAFHFLGVPTMENRLFPATAFNHAVDNKIVELVEVVPDYVFEISKAQYIKNKEIK
jgi:hypothetical protein